jgi:maltoporin
MNKTYYNKHRLATMAAAALCILPDARAAEVAGIDLYGYTRGGFYSSRDDAPRGGYTLGGDAQKFRLGNEGDNGIEFGIGKTFNAGNGLTFGAFYMPTVWNGKNGTDEAYATLSGLPFAPEAEFWAGQRRLRLQDVHIVDKFFADYGDNLGAGVRKLQLGPVKLGVGVFTSDSYNNDVSRPNQASRLNVDVSGIAINPGGELRITATKVFGDFQYGHDGAGLSLVHNQTDFLVPGLKNALFLQAANGHAGLSGQFFGLDSPGTTSLVVGPGGVVTPLTNPPTPNAGHKSWRAVDSLSWQAGRFGGQTIMAYEHSKADGGAADGVVTKDISIGGRVSYAFTDHLKLLADAGTTSRAVDGQPTQRLHKLTIAPTLSLGPGIFSRPELRLYATRVKWNDAAAAAHATSFGASGRTSATLFGVQIEAWW